MAFERVDSLLSDFDSWMDRDNYCEVVIVMPSGVVVYIVSRNAGDATDKESLIKTFSELYPGKKVVFHPHYMECILSEISVYDENMPHFSKAESVSIVKEKRVGLNELWAKVRTMVSKAYDSSRDRPKDRRGKPMKPWSKQ